jgi:hypothetical protein
MQLFDIASSSDELVAAFRGITDVNELYAASEIEAFSMLVHRGCRSIFYRSEIKRKPNSSYHDFFWLTNDHGMLLGQSLCRSLDFLGITLTCVEDSGFAHLQRNVLAEVRVEHLFIWHTTGDEVTRREASHLGKLAAWLGATTLRLWAPEFDRGSVDALCDELKAPGNQRLCWLDIQHVATSTSIPTPSVETMLAANRARRPD